jgi:hypothetical protein
VKRFGPKSMAPGQALLWTLRVDYHGQVPEQDTLRRRKGIPEEAALGVGGLRGHIAPVYT